jgi:threonine dehydratase
MVKFCGSLCLLMQVEYNAPMARVYPPTMREILSAHVSMRPYVYRTPLRPSLALSAQSGSDVYLKLENWQPTGSFKVRGAVNFLAQLTEEEKAHGLVTASAGNHALAVGYAAQQLSISGITVFLPCPAPRAKVEKLARFPITVRQVGESYEDAHRAAEEFERVHHATFIHAYDDARTIAGAGTIGLEVLEELPAADAILVPVGGGGMIAGIALAVKSLAPHVKVYGIQPEASPALRDSLRDGRAYEHYDAAPTICDGLAGGIGQIGFEVARKCVDDVLVVSEDAVKRAVASFARDEQMFVEGSGAVGLAALAEYPGVLGGRRNVLIVSGANIDAKVLASIVEQWA